MSNQYWGIVPAAGIGSRMKADKPKQYLPLSNTTVIECSLNHLLHLPVISSVVVAISCDDSYWKTLDISANQRLTVIDGGTERSQSVLNALEFLSQKARRDDWVLVHDAARPCVHPSDIIKLINTLKEHPVGGLLASPVRDTMKRVTDDLQVINTIERRNLWQALTPQMFRFGLLHQALKESLDKNFPVTDESSAIEQAGYTPQMVEGRSDNIKITHPSDLGLAEIYLNAQKQER